jgi:hypothetical protein
LRGDYTNDLNFRNSTRRASKQSDNKPGKIPAVQVHKEKLAVPDSTVYEANDLLDVVKKSPVTNCCARKIPLAAQAIRYVRCPAE